MVSAALSHHGRCSKPVPPDRTRPSPITLSVSPRHRLVRLAVHAQPTCLTLRPRHGRPGLECHGRVTQPPPPRRRRRRRRRRVEPAQARLCLRSPRAPRRGEAVCAPAPHRSQRAAPGHRARASCGAPVREGAAASEAAPPFQSRHEELLGTRAGLAACDPRAPRAACGAFSPVADYDLGLGGTSLACRLGHLHACRLAAPPHTPSHPEPRVTRRPPP